MKRVRWIRPLLAGLLLGSMLSSCDLNRPRLLILEPTPITDAQGMVSVVVSLETSVMERATANLVLRNRGNNTLSFSLIPEQIEALALQRTPNQSTRISAGKSETARMELQCPAEAGEYSNFLTLKTNDIRQPEVLIAVTLRCNP